MRIPAKVDYAIRTMAELAAADGSPVKAEHLAGAQDIPLKYLRAILGDLRRARLVSSHRGPDGGFVLAQPANSISLADVFRVIDGPLATVRDQSLRALSHEGPASDLPVVWMAVRAGLRRILENVTIQDLVSDGLPRFVTELAEEYRVDTVLRHADEIG